MRRNQGQYIYSPSDLINFMQSEFITWMDRYHLDFPESVSPDEPTDELKLIQQAGIEHEDRFLKRLLSDGHDVCDLSMASEQRMPTLRAMREGREVLYQPYLQDGEFAGYPDFLARVDDPSSLGAWSYEVWDTKLARHPKPYYLIQLCCYAEMLERVTGSRPRRLKVVLGSGEISVFRTEDFVYYYGSLKAAFLEQQRTFNPGQPPEIPPLQDLGRWSGYASQCLNDRDDLSLVANIRRSQIRRLREAGITTLAGLAAGVDRHVPRINSATLDRLQRQAALQAASRGLERPRYELLPPDPERSLTGLAGLPPASPSDVFFDIEGYPLIEGGLEYLFGACYLEGERMKFRDWWAHDRVQEKVAFQSFVRWAYERWKADAAMHIYHYAPYEITALRRLMGRFAVCEGEVDDLLRNGVFVDLYAVLRQSLLVGEPSYSLKYVERLYRGRRQGTVGTASDSMVCYQAWLVQQDGADPESSTLLQQIRDYNEEDCRSTAQLADWLRRVQQDQGIEAPAAADCVAPADQQLEDSLRQRRADYEKELVDEIPEDRSKAPEHWRLHELLAYLLQFHRREEKPVWWRRFDWHEMEEQELVDDPVCLGGLQRTDRLPYAAQRSKVFEYRFDPKQETKIREGDDCILTHDLDFKALVLRLDLDGGLLELKVGPSRGAPPSRIHLMPDEPIVGETLAASIERLVRRYHTASVLPRALEDLLYRRRPRLAGNPSGPIVKTGSDPVDGAVEAVLSMYETTLCVQGPPGTGKSFSAAQMIVALLLRGNRVGITSNSHRAICLLMQKTLAAAAEIGHSVTAAKVGRAGTDHELPADVELVESGRKLFEGGRIPQLVGGTAWAFAQEAAEGRLDYLFVDEAGQVSLANLVAMASSTKNIVLLGDQMQLGQPIQGVHPGESGQSTLDYLLKGQATIPEDFGIFLGRTWRLHPQVCRFVSGAVYDGRLESMPFTAERVLVSDQSLDWLHCEAGIAYVPVDHEDDVYESREEAERISELVADLTRQRLRTEDGIVRNLTHEDILVVAPYNLQVRRLQSRIPSVRVGTVDKFQGQEAPVVIFSMTSSSGNASSRGVEFLYSQSRLNVAISRAQTLAVIVGHPSLEIPRCSTIEQIQLVNMYCRALHEARADAFPAAQ